MTGCFDFRLRASPSVDLDRMQVDQDAPRFQMSFSKLFRSRSDGSVKSARSQSEGPTARSRSSRCLRSPSPVASSGNRRRYVRVVRSDDTRETRHPSGDNVHVIIRSRSYSSTDRMRLKKSASADAGVTAGSRAGAQLQRSASPYTSSGHTILKKYNHSLDAGTGTGDSALAGGVAAEVSPPNSKHASFREEVEILEYDTQGKALLVKCVTHTKKLNYENDDDEDDSLNIDDSFDDDLESTDFSLSEIQDETTTSASATALASSLASSINKLPTETDAAAEAAKLNQSVAQENRTVDSQTTSSSSAADHSVSAFDRKGLLLGTSSSAPPGAVLISDQPKHEVLHSPRRCGGTPNVAESCLVADGHQLPISKSCQGNGRGFSTTLISCQGNSFGSLSTSDSCPENRHGSNSTMESSPGNNQNLNDHSSTCKYSPTLNHNLSDQPCPANPSSSVSNCPSASVSSSVQSSTCNESSSTSLCQPSTVQLAQTQQSQPDRSFC